MVNNNHRNETFKIITDEIEIEYLECIIKELRKKHREATEMEEWANNQIRINLEKLSELYNKQIK